MTYINAVKYLNSLSNTVASLDSSRKVLSLLSDESKQPRAIHICGADGKNSCQRMLSSILVDSGYTVGVFALPITDDLREAILINGKPVSYERFAETVKRISVKFTALEDGTLPSFDEALCIAALLCFEEEGCDVAIFEKSLRKNDAANLSEPPLVSIISSMGNTDLNTVDFSDILRRGTRETVTSPQHKDVYNAISESCADIGSRLTLPIYSELCITKINLFKTCFSYGDVEYSVRAFSPCQTVNAITVIEAANALARVGMNISTENVVSGIASTTLPYKCEAISVEPTIIVSNASTEERFPSLVASIAQINEFITGDVFIAIDENCLIDTEKMVSYLTSCGTAPKSISKISRSMTSSKLTKEISGMISPLLSESNMNSALILIAKKDFAPHLADIIRKVLGRV